MVYRAQGGSVETWYASLCRGEAWKLDRPKGISTDAFKALASENADHDE